MTESAAITLWLAEELGRDDLVPPPGSSDRARFLRWLIFLVANIYPTYTYGDVPARFVSTEAAQEDFYGRVDAYRVKLYGILEAEAGAPWFLGDRFSALDIYVAAMTHWEPGAEWFTKETPKLRAIADRTRQEPRLKETWDRNTPDA